MADAPRLVVIDEDSLRRIVAEAVKDALGGRGNDLRLLTPKEAGEVLGVGERTVLRWRKAGRLPYRELSPKVYRFVESELRAAGKRKAG